MFIKSYNVKASVSLRDSNCNCQFYDVLNILLLYLKVVYVLVL